MLAMDRMSRAENSLLLMNDNVRMLNSLDVNLSCTGNTSSLTKNDSKNRPPKPPSSMHKSFSSTMLIVEESRHSQNSIELHMSKQMSFTSNASETTSSSASDDSVEYVPIVRSGCCCEVGSRSTMEDAHVEENDLSSFLSQNECDSPNAFYAVFDGHYGVDAANYAKANLLPNLISEPAFPSEVKLALSQTYCRLDSELEQLWKSGSECGKSGTTALAALVWGRKLFIANAGDCRAVLSRKGRAIQLSTDQRPNDSSEITRIRKAGGMVEDDYLNGLLGVARALGDWHLQGLKVRDEEGNSIGPLISEPEVREEEIEEDDEFMILACDGLWDVFSNQSAVDFTRRRLQLHNDPIMCSKEIVSEALKRYCTDNVTVIIVCFKPSPPPVPAITAWRSCGMMKRSISIDGLKCLQKHLNDHQ